MNPEAEKRLARIQEILEERNALNRELERLLGVETEEEEEDEPTPRAKEKKGKRGGARPCSICHKTGHNKKTCAQNPANAPEIRYPKNEEPREDTDAEEKEDAEEEDKEVQLGKLTLKQWNSIFEAGKRGMKAPEIADLMNLSVMKVEDALDAETYREYITTRY